METATDREVWAYAKTHDFVIVTKDSDFYDLSLVLGTPPRVIWIKTRYFPKDTDFSKVHNQELG
jgi:predicted nuclease of predicted toxin-antitoxin system